jgi:RNA polymerase sigma-70 factor, ECF subfamily
MPATPEGSTAPEHAILDAVLGGDEDAFRRLVEPHRSGLHAHCYRMLGSVHDVEDVLQEVLLRAWRSLAGFEPGRPLRPWLYKIATNACLDAIARQPRHQLPADDGPHTRWPPETGMPFPPPAWVEPYPDGQLGFQDGPAAPEARYEQREAVELAFVAALQHLPARQRAVLVLREVLGFSAREVAECLGTTVASVNSALQRARKTITGRLPQRSQQATLRSLGDEHIREIAERFIDAFEAGDVNAILAMLTEDATFAMPPYEGWYRGRDAVAESWLIPSGPSPGLRYIPTRSNGQLAFGTYLLDAGRNAYLPIAVDVLTLHGTSVTDVTAFRTPELFPDFGLPDHIASSAGDEPDDRAPQSGGRQVASSS